MSGGLLVYRYIFFDLDGTLTDPGLGITNSIIYALKHWRISVSDRTVLYPFIGPPLKGSFMTYYGFSEEQAMEAIHFYREYYAEKGMYENVMYPDIPKLLEHLKAAGKKLILATSKPEKYTIPIMEHFGLSDYFDFMAGATSDEQRTKKGDVIAYAIEQMGIQDLAECVMIGDREHDVIGAHDNGMDGIGVLYGYGGREEFERVGAEHIVENVEELEKVLLS